MNAFTFDTRCTRGDSQLTGMGNVDMRSLLMRSMGWLLIAATALVLLGLAQVPELWAGA